MYPKLIMAAALSTLAMSALADPTIQSCSPLEVNHHSDYGLSYTLLCGAGPWKLKYAGAVPAGGDGVTLQYELTVTGTAGRSVTLHRSVRLPSPAHLGQVLTREAVLLDSGAVALRDCADVGCTKYRPMVDATLAGAIVTISPEVQRLRTEQRQVAAEADRLREEVASSKSQCAADTEAMVAAEKNKSAAALAEVTADAKRQADRLEAKLKAENRESRGYLAEQMAAVNAKVAVLNTTVAKQAEVASVLTKDREHAQATAWTIQTELDTVSKELLLSRALPTAQRAAYEFAISDLVSQHAAQVTALKQAMPDVNFSGIVEDLRVLIVNISTAKNKDPVPAVPNIPLSAPMPLPQAEAMGVMTVKATEPEKPGTPVARAAQDKSKKRHSARHPKSASTPEPTIPATPAGRKLAPLN